MPAWPRGLAQDAEVVQSVKAKVVSLEQGRKQVAKRQETDNRDRLAKLLADVWTKTLAQIEAEFPDVGVVGVQYDILQTPNQWWTSCWTARLKKLHYHDADGKKHYMNDKDMYADMAKFRAATGEKYRALARGQRPKLEKHVRGKR